MFIHLHGHSTFSFLEAVGTPKIIIKRAKELGFSAIAITDLYAMYGAISFYQSAHEEGIKPIIGTELGFVLDLNSTINPKTIGNICLLARDNTGYHNLLKLVSFANQEGMSHKPKIDLEQLKKYAEGLITFAGGTDSWINYLLLENNPEEKTIEILDILKQTLGEENVYLEIIAQDEAQEPEIKKINTFIQQVSEKSQIPCFVSNVYQYPRPQDKETQELAMAVKDNLKLYDPEHRKQTTVNHLMTEEEIRTICLKNQFSEENIERWIQTTADIAERCNAKITMGQTLFPVYDPNPEIMQYYEKDIEGWIGED